MYMTEKEWEDMKALGIPLNDKIVECAMDQEKRWRFLRFREDKKHGNYSGVVNSVLESIKDAVGKKDLLREAMEIRTAWKRRQGVQNVPPPAVRQPPPQGQGQYLARR